jgi:hypothetical protein
VTNGLDYLSGPGPHSVGGFAAATGSGVVDGGGAGAAGGAFAKLTHTSSIACFVAGTRVRDLRAGDVLEGSGGGATVELVEPTGETATVYNLHVEGLHTYQVATNTGVWTTVHNDCRWDATVHRWRDLDTGRFAMRPNLSSLA